MTDVLFPVGAIDSEPAFTAQGLRQVLCNLAGVAPSGRVFGATSGVRPGVPSSIVTVTATAWSVDAHPGVIDELDAVDSGAYLYALPDKTGDVTAADQTNARIDRLDVQITAGDGTTTVDTIDIKYTEGVPSSNPAVPTAPDNSFPLCQLDVPADGEGNPTFTWTAPAAGVVELFMTQTTGTDLPTGTQTTLTGWSAGTGHTDSRMDTIGVTQSFGVLTMPAGSAGRYEFSAMIGILNGNAVVATDAFLVLNSTNLYGAEVGVASSSQSVSCITLPPKPLLLSDGDTLKVTALSVGGASVTADSADLPWTSWIRLRRIG